MPSVQKIRRLCLCAGWVFLCATYLMATVVAAQDVRPRYISNMRFAPSISTLTQAMQGIDNASIPTVGLDSEQLGDTTGAKPDNRLSRWIDQTIGNAEGVLLTRGHGPSATIENPFGARTGLQADDQPEFEAGVRIPLGQHSELMGSVGAEQSRTTGRGDMRYRGRVSLRAAFRF